MTLKKQGKLFISMTHSGNYRKLFAKVILSPPLNVNRFILGHPGGVRAGNNKEKIDKEKLERK